jgi:hypothetical protein
MEPGTYQGELSTQRVREGRAVFLRKSSVVPPWGSGTEGLDCGSSAHKTGTKGASLWLRKLTRGDLSQKSDTLSFVISLLS